MRDSGHVGHLVRRALGSLSRAEPPATDIDAVRGVLLPAEFDLWDRMQAMDKRHSLHVWRRFVELRPAAPRPEQAAALLHDLGKVQSRLGWAGRVVATVAGGVTTRMKDYRDHEAIGCRMLSGISEHRTLELLSGAARDEAADTLRLADEV